MTDTIKDAIAARYTAQQTLTTALRKFYEALQAEVTATAKDAAARGMAHSKFLEACIGNARTNSASWSGGPQSTPNVIEALTAHAWLAAASDLHTSFLFNKDQQS